jgi:hypothetical protein
MVNGREPELTITATVDDTANGNRVIVAAQYAIDTPPWLEGATLYNLSALDNAFNSPVEPVTAAIVTNGLTAGRHTIFMRGQDNQGNWGPVSAAFFDFNAKRAFLPIVADQ